jgi:D-alanyl-D-alanine dipeptidase
MEAQLIESGEINQRELQNRQLVREIMTEAGWLVEPSEWWHFNAMPLSEASQKLTVIK